MKEYMTSVFAVSALLSLLSHISYKSLLDKTRTVAFGVILLSIVLTPAVSAIGKLSDFKLESLLPQNSYTPEDNAELYESAFADGISTAVCEKFELKEKDVRVLIVGFSADGWKCEKIRIILSGAAVFADITGIERFINRLEIGECEAEIEIG